MKIGESSPLYETHSCLHENDGARLDRSLMDRLLRYDGIEASDREKVMMKTICLVAAIDTRYSAAFGSGFYRLVRKFFTACVSLHTIVFVPILRGIWFSHTYIYSSFGHSSDYLLLHSLRLLCIARCAISVSHSPDAEERLNDEN